MRNKYSGKALSILHGISYCLLELDCRLVPTLLLFLGPPFLFSRFLSCCFTWSSLVFNLILTAYLINEAFCQSLLSFLGIILQKTGGPPCNMTIICQMFVCIPMYFSLLPAVAEDIYV